MKKTLLFFGLCFSITASASVITYENRATNAGVNKNDYQSSWLQQTSTIYTSEIEEFDRLRANGSRRNQHSHLSINFDISDNFAGLDWWFQFSPDAGLGGELYFDGNLVTRTNDNLWWGYNWNRTNELIDALLEDVSAGSHVLDVYWAENCCNGGQSGRYSLDNGKTWLALTTENLDKVNVPEPGTIALLAFGLAGLAMSRRKQKTQ